MKTPKEVLLLAAALIEKFGWCQHVYQKGVDGPVCLAGAVRLATWGEVYPTLTSVISFEQQSEYGQAVAALMARTDDGGVTTYNDTPGRTKEQVLNFLRRVAEAV